MLHGKFIKVVNFDDPMELLGVVNEGYLKVAWRKENELVVGYILVSDARIIGAIVEGITTNKIIKGQEALEKISQATQEKKIKVVELYEANIKEILSNMPESKVKIQVKSDAYELNLKEFLRLLSTHIGEISVHNNETSWRLQVSRGIVQAAKTTGNSHFTGDNAIRQLLNEMGQVMKEGHYNVGTGWKVAPEEKVKNGKLLLEGVKLLNEKQKIQKMLERKT